MKLLPAIFFAALACGNAFAWGCEGHRMVALIASQHLTPEARAAVYRLLKDNPIDPAIRRYCRPVATDPMEDAATWADDVRTREKNEKWHYIDIPRDVEHGDFMKYCPPTGDTKDRPGCIITALRYELDILKDRNRLASERATAVRYIIHFIGDLHQPLHSTNDVGGNCTSVTLFAETRRGNLHSAWDSGILRHSLQENKQTPEQMAAQIDRQYQAKGRKWLHGRIDFVAWLWESHRTAVKVTYGKLEPKVPLGDAQENTPSCDTEREKTAALNIHIDEKYAAAAMPAIDEQIAKAAYRLADVLNSAF